VHGTWAANSADFRQGSKFFEHVAKTMGDHAMASFTWSGADNHGARMSAAAALRSFINHYHFAPGEQLNIVGHSHGGNVEIAAINMGLKHRVDNLVTLGTPSVPAYRLQGNGAVANWVHLFNRFDQVQTHGGGEWDSDPQTGPAARTHPYATNIAWDVDFGPFESHKMLHTPQAWDRVLPHLDRLEDPLQKMPVIEVRD
jgi:hypothetical protein